MHISDKCDANNEILWKLCENIKYYIGSNERDKDK